MSTASLVITICWTLLLVYWVISARFVKATEERTGGIGGYWHYVLAAFAVLLLQRLPVYPLTIPLLGHSVAVDILSSVCALCGLGIALTARRSLAGNWSGSVTFKRNHTLVTTGIYRYMRHPIYTGILLMFVGTALLAGTLGAVLGFLILLVTFWLKLKQEEALMERHFPKDYPEYKRQVKALIPYVF